MSEKKESKQGTCCSLVTAGRRRSPPGTSVWHKLRPDASKRFTPLPGTSEKRRPRPGTPRRLVPLPGTSERRRPRPGTPRKQGLQTAAAVRCAPYCDVDRHKIGWSRARGSIQRRQHLRERRCTAHTPVIRHRTWSHLSDSQSCSSFSGAAVPRAVHESSTLIA